MRVCGTLWIEDPDVSGQHRLIPVAHDEYVSALEDALAAADSTALDAIQKAYGISKEDTAHDSANA